MFIVSNYLLAVVFCFITMLCWGSWGNTQKMAAKSWRYELFYWDYVIGMVLFALLIAFTMGSFGTEGRPFLEDIVQVSAKNIGSIILGGIIFNASNILLSASTSIAGMAVAFPLGVGISLVLGTIVNYIGAPKGDPMTLFIGVALIVVAIVCNGIASGKLQKEKKVGANKGIILANISYTDGAPQHGPGWACGYSGKLLVNSCAKGGRVGEWDTYKNDPSSAPEATMDNALCYKNSEYFDPSANF